MTARQQGTVQLTAIAEDATAAIDDEPEATLRARAATIAAGIVLGVALASVLLLAMGWRPIVLQSDAMAPTIKAYSVLIAHPIEPDDVQIGDVITFPRVGEPAVTRRVVSIGLDTGAPVAQLQGDGNDTPDPGGVVLEAGLMRSVLSVPLVGWLFTAGLGLLVGLLVLAAAVTLWTMRRRAADASVDAGVVASPLEARSSSAESAVDPEVSVQDAVSVEPQRSVEPEASLEPTEPEPDVSAASDEPEPEASIEPTETEPVLSVAPDEPEPEASVEPEAPAVPQESADPQESVGPEASLEPEGSVDAEPLVTDEVDPRFTALGATLEAFVEDGVPASVVLAIARSRSGALLGMAPLELSAPAQLLDDGARFVLFAFADADMDALAVVPPGSERSRAATRAVADWWLSVAQEVPTAVWAEVGTFLNEANSG